MQTKPRHTVVVIPNESKLEVSYYCSDKKVKEKEKKNFTDLIIQLHDCHSAIKISKTKAGDANDLEAIVQKTVINARGHLCD
jgi:hypothetical protein